VRKGITTRGGRREREEEKEEERVGETYCEENLKEGGKMVGKRKQT